ncbi:unnamed protein product [Diamesa serratosioi]
MNNNLLTPQYASLKPSPGMIFVSPAPGVHRKKRRENFDFNETKLLLKFWGEPEMQENMRSNYLKTPFIEEIATKMRMHGFNRTTKEVETRLRTMKCSYTRIRKDLEAGWIRKPTWKYYNDVHAILGSSVGTSDQQSTQPLDLSTSPTIKSEINFFTTKPAETPALKTTIKRTNLKKWIPVPLKIAKDLPSSLQVRDFNHQQVIHSNKDATSDTSTQQVFSVNENHSGNLESQNQRVKQSLLREALENKDETNLVSINEKNIASILRIEQQRLEIEKERFGFEKFVGNAILSMCHTLIENSKK